MKINEKNLCSFATSTPVDLEGYLNKRGEVNKNFQRRWFVLKGNLLFYFERKGDKEPLGMIILEGCTIELAEEGESYCFQIIFHGPNNRTYVLSAENQTIMEMWMKALTCAGYDYMKLMVQELQRQLDEMDGQKGVQTPENTTPKPPPRRTNPFNKPTTTATSLATSSNTTAANGNGFNNLMTSNNGFSNEASTANVNVPARPAPAIPKQPQPLSQPPQQLQQQPQKLLQHDLVNLDDNELQMKSEFSFKNLHEIIGKPIRDEINERRAQKLRAEQPLIFF